MIILVITIILAIFCLIYAAMVYATGSGTSFFLIWIGIGIVLFLLGISVYMEVWKKVPHPVKILAGTIVCIGLLAFFIVEGCVISQMHAGGRAGLDYIIVLGAQVRKDGPSPVLRYRLDKAVEYLDENPDTVCIVSGGQGSNEPWPEAEGMAQYLQQKGIAATRILLEDQSQTTEQNIMNSKQLMKDGASVGVVTNNFHVFRAMQIAKKYGLSDACGIAAGSTAKYLPNNMLREFFAEIKWLCSSSVSGQTKEAELQKNTQEQQVEYEVSDWNLRTDNPIDKVFYETVNKPSRQLCEAQIRDLQKLYYHIWKQQYDTVLEQMKERCQYKEDEQNLKAWEKSVKSQLETVEPVLANEITDGYETKPEQKVQNYGNGTQARLLLCKGMVYRDVCMLIFSTGDYEDTLIPEKDVEKQIEKLK